MIHEALNLTEDKRWELGQKFSSVVLELAHPTVIHAVSSALLYRSPESVIEPSLQRLWRY